MINASTLRISTESEQRELLQFKKKKKLKNGNQPLKHNFISRALRTQIECGGLSIGMHINFETEWYFFFFAN